MSKYITQLRRGVKNDAAGIDDWAAYEATDKHVKPIAGELVLEYDNGIPRLKIGDGAKEFSELPYMSIDSFILPKPTTITLYGGDAWVPVQGFDNRYTQDITSQLEGLFTANSKIDLQPTPEQLCVFQSKDVTFTTVNENGIVRVCAIGIRPENDYPVQATITEVVVDGKEIVGNTTATPYPRPDWNQTDATKADYIKNKPNSLGGEVEWGNF